MKLSSLLTRGGLSSPHSSAVRLSGTFHSWWTPTSWPSTKHMCVDVSKVSWNIICSLRAGVMIWMFVSFPNSGIGILTPNVEVLGHRISSHKWDKCPYKKSHSLLTSYHHGRTHGEAAVLSTDDSPHRNLTMLESWPQMSTPGNSEREMSVVAKSPRLWHFVIADWAKTVSLTRRYYRLY